MTLSSEKVTPEERHRDHWHSEIMVQRRPIRHAAYQLTNLSFLVRSIFIMASSKLLSNVYATTARCSSHAKQLLLRTQSSRYILNSYILTTLSSLQSHIRFWNHYGRRQFQENMRRLRNARDMLGEVHMFGALPERFAL